MSHTSSTNACMQEQFEAAHNTLNKSCLTYQLVLSHVSMTYVSRTMRVCRRNSMRHTRSSTPTKICCTIPTCFFSWRLYVAHARTRTHTHARTHAKVRTHTHTKVRTHTHAHAHAHTQVRTHIRTHAYTHTKIRAHTHESTYNTYIYAFFTHAHTHKHYTHAHQHS